MTEQKYRVLPLLVALVATPVLAQSTLDWPVGEFSPYHLDSGSVANPERGFSAVFEAAVTVETAVWLRLYFGEAELDAGSFVRMTSALDVIPTRTLRALSRRASATTFLTMRSIIRSL